MRSRASRRRLSDNDIRCSASDRRWFPARPAQQVDRRRNNGKGRIPSTLASAHGRNGKRRVETCNALQRRTRRSASTIGSAAPDTIIGRATADRAGARPYRATRCEKRVEMCHYTRASSPRCLLHARVAAPILPGSSMHRPAAEANGQYRKDQNTPGDLLPVEVPTDQ